LRILSYIVLFLFYSNSILAQSSIERFLKPADTLQIKRLQTVVFTESVIGSTTLIGLNQIWYANYPHSQFHFINDNNEWLQMDKMGHVFSSYQIGSFGANALKWSGSNKKSQLLYGATLGLGFQTAVEVFDGYSSNWGASMGDVLANVSGTALYVSQELIWHEQRILPKFSFHTTHYAALRPDILGSSIQEQLLKDYNGQTYWLSANIYSFIKVNEFPKWLNLAIGYGAEGMISGEASTIVPGILDLDRYRQYYISFDVDLTKIKSKSHVIQTLLSVFNTIKIPAPTFEIKGNGGSKLHLIYF
jgi:hypothetical protein